MTQLDQLKQYTVVVADTVPDGVLVVLSFEAGTFCCTIGSATTVAGFALVIQKIKNASAKINTAMASPNSIFVFRSIIKCIY